MRASDAGIEVKVQTQTLAVATTKTRSGNSAWDREKAEVEVLQIEDAAPAKEIATLRITMALILVKRLVPTWIG
jgi:hypothetical protein